MNLLQRVAMITTFCLLCALTTPPHGAAAAVTRTTLFTFPHGVWPMTGLVSGPGGALYGATNSTIYQVAESVSGRWEEKTIFGTGAATLVGSATALYAATNTGNTVFELLPPGKGSTVWKGTVLHVFKGGKDGSQPLGLTLASDGSLFGTTQLGGGAAACGSQNGVPSGCGTFFQLVEVKGRWGERLLHAFQGGADGAIPVASPWIDAAGNVYLTTSSGGVPPAKSSGIAPRDIADGCGMIAARWSVETGSSPKEEFFEFNICVYFALENYYYPESKPLGDPLFVKPESLEDGRAASTFPRAAAPASQLIFTTTGGGDHSQFCLDTSFDGCGTIAEFTRTSSTTKPWDAKILHEFSGTDGFSPMGDLTADGAGHVYGVAGSAVGSCADQGCGEIFALDYGKTGWAWGGVLYRFTTDAFPVPQLTLYKGKLLGTTSGYNISAGTIYELTP